MIIYSYVKKVSIVTDTYYYQIFCMWTSTIPIMNAIPQQVNMKDSLIHRPSSQGWAPGVLPFFVQVFCLSPVCTWMEGWGEEGGYLLLSFLLSIFLG